MLPKTNPKRGKLKIIFDSNALFVPLQLKIDIFEELKTLLNRNFEPILPKPIKDELEKIAIKGPPKLRKEAAYALKMAEKCTLVDLGEGFAGSPDDAIVKLAGEWKCPVFTDDRRLRKRLRDISVPVIYVRQKSRLEINGRW
ncbi:MAG: DNA-binding protein [Candidatus Bathyarchaeia archaeon]